MLPLFAITIFLAAALLFLVEPIAAKLILPQLGGTPAVWNGSMLFFQAALLAGYLAAHLVGKLKARAQTVVYSLALIAPIVVSLVLRRMVVTGPDSAPPDEGWPVPWLLGALTVMVGAPVFLLSIAGPLLQRWFSGTSHRSAKDPYFLYAASNAGSMVGLLGYPVLVEPALTLTGQRRAWSLGFALVAVLITVCGVVAVRMPGEAVVAASEPPVNRPSWRVRGQWLLLAAIPSSLTLGVTQHLSTDIASAPLLWVVPLALYLLTFIIAFSRWAPSLARVSNAIPPFVLAIAVTALFYAQKHAALLIGLHLCGLFLCALLCHLRLASLRPDARFLTEYYLVISAGGVAGGVFNALAAPLLFNSIVEYPIALVLALFMRKPGAGQRRLGLAAAFAAPVVILILLIALAGLGARLGLSPEMTIVLWLIPPVIVCLACWSLPYAFALSIGAMLGLAIYNSNLEQANVHHSRSFFGVYRIFRNGVFTVMVHGTTVHGFQAVETDKKGLPLGYYHRDGPIGQFFGAMKSSPVLDRVGVVGLGAGALAAYGRPGMEMVFHELDPQDIALASRKEYFSYLSDSKARIRTVPGDGRLTLGVVPDGAYGAVILDAFSSDAVPVHLITREAVEVYLAKLAPRGVIAFHISNRFLDLEPVLGRIAADLKLVAIAKSERADDPATAQRFAESGRSAAHWVLLARNIFDFGDLARDRSWRQLPLDPSAPLWTDDYCNILGVFRWD